MTTTQGYKLRGGLANSNPTHAHIPEARGERPLTDTLHDLTHSDRKAGARGLPVSASLTLPLQAHRHNPDFYRGVGNPN